ncbi:MAG: hypothetical protein QXQ50_04540 [Candidatus Bathyarchaeia archaeon]
MERDEQPGEIIKRALAGSVEGEESAMTAREELAMAYELAYLLRDDGVFNLFKNDPRLRDYIVLRPALSHLNRTTNMSGFDAEIFKRRFKLALDLILFSRSERELTMTEIALKEGLLVYGCCVASDAVGGWRGRLITERTRVYRVESGEKKRGLLSRLFGR